MNMNTIISDFKADCFFVANINAVGIEKFFPLYKLNNILINFAVYCCHLLPSLKSKTT